MRISLINRDQIDVPILIFNCFIFMTKGVTAIAFGVQGVYWIRKKTENLRYLGLDVRLIELADQVMTSVDKEMSIPIMRALKAAEVNVVLEYGVAEFAQNDRQLLANC